MIYKKVLHYFILKKKQYSVQDGCQIQIGPKDDIDVNFQVNFFAKIPYIVLHICIYSAVQST